MNLLYCHEDQMGEWCKISVNCKVQGNDHVVQLSENIERKILEYCSIFLTPAGFLFSVQRCFTGHVPVGEGQDV